MKIRGCSLILLLAVNSLLFRAMAQHASLVIDSSVNLVDGAIAPYNLVQAGDSIYLTGSSRDKLLIRNFTGAANKPIVFINKTGTVIIKSDSYYGISIINCRYIKLSGNGNNSGGYGIQIQKVAAGAGIGIGARSSDFEIDHIAISNCATEGIFAKTDPDCSLKASRDNFTQYNTSIHDNYISDVGNEGMYIGSSNYFGLTITCNGKDTVVLPPVLDTVKIYNNIVKNTGWDGIQVSSAPLNCQIFNNLVSGDSQAEMPNQMSGIIIGGGSKCNCYNNMVTNGKGDGIEYHGIGGNSIFNNIIVNAGQTYLPADASKMKHGIFVSDVSLINDSSVCILFNDIINPKSDGIRFQSVKSRHNLISSNLIVNPGNYNLYETDNTAFTGNDAFIMVPNTAAELILNSNYFSRTIGAAGISAIDYTILRGSPLINMAGPFDGNISFDFRNHRRPAGGLYDIGAMEYDDGIDTLLHTAQDKVSAFPNPAHSLLTIRYLAVDTRKVMVNIYTSKGELALRQSAGVTTAGIQEINIETIRLAAGIYFYVIQNSLETSYGKFIKF